MKPGEDLNLIFLYLLAEAAARFNMTILAYVAMSNHMHLVVHDNDGRLPEFLCHLNKMIAKVLNPFWERTENFWSNEQASAVYLVQANDRFEKIIYTLVNPVADHLVARAQEWPGATAYSQLLTGKTLTIKRPKRFFRDKGPMPKSVDLKLGRPNGFEDLTHEAWTALVKDAVRAAEKKAQAARDADPEIKKRFVGRKKVLAASHRQTGKRVEPRNELSPTVACLNRERRWLELDAVESFRRGHEAARKEWCKGDRTVLFPFGTYKMKTFGVLIMRGPPVAAEAPPARTPRPATRAKTAKPALQKAASRLGGRAANAPSARKTPRAS